MSLLHRKARLKTSYRDQLIRELQHLQSAKEIRFSDEVTDLMSAVMREQARQKNVASEPLWWHWLSAQTVRRDDAILASDLYLLEATLVDHVSLGELKIRVAGFRDMLSHLLTRESYHALARQFLDLSNDKLKINDLKDEAHAISSWVYRRYEGVPAVESARQRYTFWILALLAVIVVCLYMLSGWVSMPVVMMGAAGSVGAAASTVQRLYRLDPRHDPFKMSLALESAWVNMFLAPALGAVFALVLLMIFRAGLIDGSAIPNFDVGWTLLSSEPRSDVQSEYAGMGERDVALLIAWGFLAGWAERLVPDVLDKLAPKVTADARAKWK